MNLFVLPQFCCFSVRFKSSVLLNPSASKLLTLTQKVLWHYGHSISWWCLTFWVSLSFTNFEIQRGNQISFFVSGISKAKNNLILVARLFILLLKFALLFSFGLGSSLALIMLVIKQHLLFTQTDPIEHQNITFDCLCWCCSMQAVFMMRTWQKSLRGKPMASPWQYMTK